MRHQGLWSAPRPAADAPARLFCLPFAGGQAGAFYRWAPAFAGLAELWALQMPGRGARFNEAPLRDMAAATRRIADDLAPLLDRPYALFGHSLGGRLAADLCVELQSRRWPLPQRLICSGSLPPQLRRLPPYLHQLDDDAFVDELRVLGGTPPEVLADRRLLAPFLPALRADFELFESCRWRGPSPLPVDMDIWAGLDDPRVPPDVALHWASLGGQRVRERFFAGGHMFITDEQSGTACLAALQQILRESLAPQPGAFATTP